jgi:hypothetical protein
MAETDDEISTRVHPCSRLLGRSACEVVIAIARGCGGIGDFFSSFSGDTYKYLRFGTTRIGSTSSIGQEKQTVLNR